MRRDLFQSRFRKAVEEARDFARELVEEPLPDAMVFRVHLNCSYDGHAGAEFKLFPADSSDDRAPALKGISEEQVILALWRDGYVPQWIDVAVVSETGAATVIDVSACGRFIDDEARLYYTWTDVAPFGVKGPILPVGYVEGQRFSIHERFSCWSLEDLERTRRHAATIRFLSLHGPVFDDAALALLATFPRLEVLEITGASVRGPGLRGLAHLPRLRHLRAGFRHAESLSLSSLPRLPTLESLTLTALPSVVAGIPRLGEAAPRLRELTLGSESAVEADGELVARTVRHLDLALPVIPSWVAIPSELRWLAIRAADASDADVLRILACCPTSLDSLGLRGTPVSDRILEGLERFPDLAYLDVVDTGVRPVALERFATRRGAGFKCLPALRQPPVLSFESGRSGASILDAEVEALVNPVNCVGVMGRGLALGFKHAFPDAFRAYEAACDAGRMVPGRVHVVEPTAARPRYVVHFPTKRHWRDASTIEDIEAGLADLVRVVSERRIRSIALPALGCGLGGLEWKVVRERIVDAFSSSDALQVDVRVVLFEPKA